MKNVVKIKELETERDRLKKMVRVRDHMINTLREDLKTQMAGHVEIMQIVGAFFSLMLEGKTMKVNKHEISDRIGKYVVQMTEEPETESYVLRIAEAEAVV